MDLQKKSTKEHTLKKKKSLASFLIKKKQVKINMLKRAYFEILISQTVHRVDSFLLFDLFLKVHPTLEWPVSSVGYKAWC